MKKTLVVLVLALFAISFLAIGCGDDEEEGNSDCYAYCDKTKECDSSGAVTDQAVEGCKTACDNDDGTLDSTVVSCGSEPDCDSFFECLAGGGE